MLFLAIYIACLFPWYRSTESQKFYIHFHPKIKVVAFHYRCFSKILDSNYLIERLSLLVKIHTKLHCLIWTSTWGFGTNCIGIKSRLKRACTAIRLDLGSELRYVSSEGLGVYALGICGNLVCWLNRT